MKMRMLAISCTVCLLVYLKANFDVAPYLFTVLPFITQYMHKGIRLPYMTRIIGFVHLNEQDPKI